ncbi:MAG TPA: 6-carboxytetrahydropterin synthase [bacterium]|nr:6-carboxytetrahydropterin synthase [bacterium]
MPYEIKVAGSFAAAHALRGYGGACERLHGHNFKVTAAARARELNEVGIALDFKEFSSYLGDVLELLDHQNLNELPPFRERNATAENIAAYIFGQLAPRLEQTGAKLNRVTVEESEKYAASFGPDV